MGICPLLPAELEELGDEVGAGAGGQPGSGLGEQCWGKEEGAPAMLQLFITLLP